jgi:hypothetical protein
VSAADIRPVAEGVRVSWHTRNSEILGEGKRQFNRESARINTVVVVGVDEYSVANPARRQVPCRPDQRPNRPASLPDQFGRLGPYTHSVILNSGSFSIHGCRPTRIVVSHGQYAEPSPACYLRHRGHETSARPHQRLNAAAACPYAAEKAACCQALLTGRFATGDW